MDVFFDQIKKTSIEVEALSSGLMFLSDDKDKPDVHHQPDKPDISDKPGVADKPDTSLFYIVGFGVVACIAFLLMCIVIIIQCKRSVSIPSCPFLPHGFC